MKKRILAYLGSQKKERTQCEVYEAVTGRRDVIATALSILCEESIISCSGDGVRCDPRRYILNGGNQRRAVSPIESHIATPQLESLTDNMEILI